MDSLIVKDGLDKDKHFISTTSGETPSTIKINKDESSYEIHLEEDYLNEIGFDFENGKITVSLVASTDENDNRINFPDKNATTSVAPILSLSTIIGESLTPVNFIADGKIATDFINQSLRVNLCYSIFAESDSKKDVPVGCAVFKLIYKVTDEDNKNSTLISSSIDTFGLEDTSFETSFAPAFEIAESFDGQSKSQLGGWNTGEIYN